MIYLVRHGQTKYNVERRIQGHGDSPLTTLGRDQARLMGLTLGRLIDGGDATIFASPLGRTQDTARILAQAAGIETPILFDDDLKEVGLGVWEGLTGTQIAHKWPDFPSRDAMDWHFQSPDGENYEGLSARLARALDRVRAHPGAHKVIVSHGVSGRLLRGIHAGLPRHETLAQDIPQDALFILEQGGIRRIECAEA
jgi:probable phosphoglycerate mutase